MVEDVERVLIGMNYNGDMSQMANIVAKNTSGSFITRTLHLEGQKVFESMKWRIDLAPRLNGDSRNMIVQIYFN